MAFTGHRGMLLAAPILAVILGGTAQGSPTAEQTTERQDYRFSGVGLGLSGVMPIGRAYGDASGGVGFDLFYWMERPLYGIEPRIGVRVDTDTSDRSFIEVPLDLGLFCIPIQASIAPYFGVGGGIRFIQETRPVFVQTGNLLITEGINEQKDKGVGGSIYARVGFLAARRSGFRVNLHLDYNLTFLDLNQQGFPQGVSLGMSFAF